MKKYYIYILLFIIIIGCSTISDKEKQEPTVSKQDTIKKTDTDIIKLDIPVTRKHNISMKAKIKIAFPNIKQSVTAKMYLAKTDSMLIQLYGPLGIPVGKLFSNKEYFIMNNNLESTTYTGKPNVENLKRIMNVPLSFHDLICLLQAILPSNIESFMFHQSSKTENIFNSIGVDYMETVVCSNKDNSFLQFIRKNINNIEIFNVKYINYQNKFPQNITIDFKTLNGQIDIEYKDVNFLDKDFEILSFVKPNSYKLVKY